MAVNACDDEWALRVGIRMTTNFSDHNYVSVAQRYYTTSERTFEMSHHLRRIQVVECGVCV